MPAPARLLAAIALLSAAPALPQASVQDTAFTIAVIPDTQNYIDHTHQKAERFPFDASVMFLEQMRYVAANVESAGGDIAFVTALGDIWQHSSIAIDPGHAARGYRPVDSELARHFAPTPRTKAVEMPMAREGYRLIAGKVPFSVVPGNHDYDATWIDARRLPAADGKPPREVAHAGGLDNFRSVFSDRSDFFRDKPWYVAAHDGGADSAQLFTAGGYRFLHIGLQFNAPDASLDWAAQVMRRYPGVPTIVSTHDYLSTAGERRSSPVIDQAALDPMDNDPQAVWDKFVSRHDQIFMVLCGHQRAQAFRTDPNVRGHKVYQLLSDYQSRKQTAKDAGVAMEGGAGIGDGWMRLMTFDMGPAIPTVRVRTYSTHYRKASADTPQYLAWYKAEEHPAKSDAAYLAGDDFRIDLDDFRARFDRTARVKR
jgi:hypothetical protein